MNIMTTETSHTALVHLALHKVVSLHSILVPGAIRKVCEARFSEFVLFQFPIIFKVQSLMKANRPIVVLRFDWVLQRLTLRMALDAGVVGANEIQFCRIDYI